MCCAPLAAIVCYAATATWVMPEAHYWGTGLVTAALLGVAAGLLCIALSPEQVAVRIFLALFYPPAAIGGTVWFLALLDNLIFGRF
jgi:hypothetical protein